MTLIQLLSNDEVLIIKNASSHLADRLGKQITELTVSDILNISIAIGNRNIGESHIAVNFFDKILTKLKIS